MSGTPRFNLPLLSAGQAQKEFTVNEGLQALDSLVCPAVEAALVNDPPASPVMGSAYIVGTAPSGAWVGNSQALATYTSGGWRFIAPVEGMTAYVRADSQEVRYRTGAWEAGVVRGENLVLGGLQVVGSRQAAIADPSGGTTIDTQARTSIGQILTAMRAHGLIDP